MPNITESAVRSQLRRLGFVLRKNRTRDPLRLDYGLYLIQDGQSGLLVAGGEGWWYSLSLDEAAAFAKELAG